MILFHGTNEERGNQIINERVLKGDSTKIYDGDDLFSTSNNYVYLTTDISLAADFGNNARIIEKSYSKYISIFMINIDICFLEKDNDQIKIKKEFFNKNYKIDNLEESLEVLRCCRKKDNINFEDFEVSYIKVEIGEVLGVRNKEFEELIKNRHKSSDTESRRERKDKFKQEFLNRSKWIKL